MKKRFFIPACVLAAAAIGFAIYAAGHPELSFPWSVQITHTLYGLYVDTVVLLFVLAFWKNATCLHVLTLLLELGAVFFSGAVHSHCFPRGETQLVFSSGAGAELRRAVPERSTAEKT